MSIRDFFLPKKRSVSNVAYWVVNDDEGCPAGYRGLNDCPEIQTACLRIAELVGTMTVYLMENTSDGDRRIINELSRMLDITPNGNMTRSHWMTANVMNMLLYGKGNGICVPHTYGGILKSLEPISGSGCRVLQGLPGHD